jgi:hypothetical protein
MSHELSVYKLKYQVPSEMSYACVGSILHHWLSPFKPTQMVSNDHHDVVCVYCGGLRRVSTASVYSVGLSLLSTRERESVNSGCLLCVCLLCMSTVCVSTVCVYWCEYCVCLLCVSTLCFYSGCLLGLYVYSVSVCLLRVSTVRVYCACLLWVSVGIWLERECLLCLCSVSIYCGCLLCASLLCVYIIIMLCVGLPGTSNVDVYCVCLLHLSLLCASTACVCYCWCMSTLCVCLLRVSTVRVYCECLL